MVQFIDSGARLPGLESSSTTYYLICRLTSSSLHDIACSRPGRLWQELQHAARSHTVFTGAGRDLCCFCGMWPAVSSGPALSQRGCGPDPLSPRGPPWPGSHCGDEANVLAQPLRTRCPEALHRCGDKESILPDHSCCQLSAAAPQD